MPNPTDRIERHLIGALIREPSQSRNVVPPARLLCSFTASRGGNGDGTCRTSIARSCVLLTHSCEVPSCRYALLVRIDVTVSAIFSLHNRRLAYDWAVGKGCILRAPRPF